MTWLGTVREKIRRDSAKITHFAVYDYRAAIDGDTPSGGGGGR